MDSAPPKKADAPAPAWVMSFADLMSLLMCFFVLLLAFSEMDVLKFKQLAGSMKVAFGVQRDIKTKEIPKGTSIIAREFSPGKPDPTAIAEVRQHTSEDKERFLQTEQDGEESLDPKTDPKVVLKKIQEKLEADASDLRETFREEVEQGLIDIETEEQRIIIRIQEQGSFPSGSAVIKGGFTPVMAKLATVLSSMKGQVVVAGHTDNVPIATARFRSNWELSAARAVSVLHHLRRSTDIHEERFLIEGHADSNPLVPNTNKESRARNRRVEIIIAQTPEEILSSSQALGLAGE